MNARRRHRLMLPLLSGRQRRRTAGTHTRVLLRLTVLMAVAATTLGLGQGTAQADPNPIEDSYRLEEQPRFPDVTWSEGAPGGTTDSCNDLQGDPQGAFTYVYPTAVGLLADHPVIVWGNGTNVDVIPDPENPEGEGTCTYETWLRYLASWGYVVVAANSSSVGNGDLLFWGAADIVNRNNDPSDPLYQKIDTTSIGVAGHSQGAQGAINAAVDHPGFFASITSFSLPHRDWVEATAPAEDVPTEAQMDALDAPIFFLWGTDDWLATGFFGPEDRTITDWAPQSGPYAAGAIVGADHTNPFSRGGLYAVAWNDYTLACHPPAIPAFVDMGGNQAEIETNSGWSSVDLQGLTAAC